MMGVQKRAFAALVYPKLQFVQFVADDPLYVFAGQGMHAEEPLEEL